jgi:hypothetical protein
MITKFETIVGKTTKTGSGGIIKLLLLAGAIYVGYKFVYLPYEAKKETK